MASTYINMYKGAVTAGGTDGTPISTDGSFTAPVSIQLNAAINEDKVQPLAIRTEAGYIADNVTIYAVNDTDNHVTFCAVANGTFTSSITIASVTATNTIFYVKASSTDTDIPQANRKIRLRSYGELRVV